MKYFTMVGSRETPEKEYNFLRKLSSKLCLEGWIPRSGGAEGADKAAEEGWWDACNIYGNSLKMEIYIPWWGFNDHMESNFDGCNINPKIMLDNWQEAEEIASQIHPVWDKLTSGAKSLHTRNIYQVLGKDLATPSKFLVCYAIPQGDSVKGGTRTSFEVAKLYDVPRFNLYNQQDLKRIQEYLGD